MLAAIRYHDTYRRVGGRWKFAERACRSCTTCRPPSTSMRSGPTCEAQPCLRRTARGRLAGVALATGGTTTGADTGASASPRVSRAGSTARRSTASSAFTTSSADEGASLSAPPSFAPVRTRGPQRRGHVVPCTSSQPSAASISRSRRPRRPSVTDRTLRLRAIAMTAVVTPRARSVVHGPPSASGRASVASNGSPRSWPR